MGCHHPFVYGLDRRDDETIAAPTAAALATAGSIPVYIGAVQFVDDWAYYVHTILILLLFFAFIERFEIGLPQSWDNWARRPPIRRQRNSSTVRGPSGSAAEANSARWPMPPDCRQARRGAR
jgi:hypothetical protein